jgi:hypothetical protein
MKITFEITDAQDARIVDGICLATGWTAESGIAKGQWAKDAVVKYMRDTAKRGQVRETMSNIGAAVDAVSIS